MNQGDSNISLEKELDYYGLLNLP
jgi:curved DNA-binding protein CbpA